MSKLGYVMSFKYDEALFYAKMLSVMPETDPVVKRMKVKLPARFYIEQGLPNPKAEESP